MAIIVGDDLLAHGLVSWMTVTGDNSAKRVSAGAAFRTTPSGARFQGRMAIS